MIKNFIKGLIFIFFIFLITEIIFFFYFKFNNIDEKIKNYKIKKISDESYKFFSDLGLVLPLPNKKIIHITKDYVDIFETKDVLKQGFGLFDDGINKNKTTTTTDTNKTNTSNEVSTIDESKTETVAKATSKTQLILQKLNRNLRTVFFWRRQMNSLIQ